MYSKKVIFIIQNIWNGKVVNDRYPYLKRKEKYAVDEETKENLIKNFPIIFRKPLRTIEKKKFL